MTKLSMSEEEMLKRKYTRPYEKRIADLEKENADLKEEINKIAFARGNLEEENAELKEKVNILDNCDRLGDVITEAYKDQLAKAKEIIKKLYSHVFQGMGFMELNDYNVQKAEAEQLISDLNIKRETKRLE